VVLLNADGMELDRESLTLGVDMTPVDANPGSGTANLSINTGSVDGFSVSVTRQETAESLGAAVQVVATVYVEGNTLILDSGTVATDCTPPLKLDDVAGSYTVTEVNIRADQDASNDPYGSDEAPTLAVQRPCKRSSSNNC